MRTLTLLAALCALVGCEDNYRRNFEHCLYYAAKGTSGGAMPPETIEACRRAAESFQRQQEGKSHD